MLFARVISAVLFYALFFLGLFNPWFVWALPVLLSVACLLALREFVHLGPYPPRHSFLLLAYGAALWMLADAYLYRLDHALLILGLLTVVSLGLGTLIRERHFAQMAGICLIGMLYATLPLALMTYIWREAVATDQFNGQHYLIFLVLVTQSADVGAYFIGRFWGRHKLAPQLSPGKTWEGFFGGVALALLVAALMKLSWNNVDRIFAWREVAVLSLLFAVVGTLGDLAESWLKRNAGIKDSGQTYTGHGGMLDVIDSLLFTTIFYYAYLGLSPKHPTEIF